MGGTPEPIFLIKCRPPPCMSAIVMTARSPLWRSQAKARLAEKLKKAEAKKKAASALAAAEAKARKAKQNKSKDSSKFNQVRYSTTSALQ